MIHIRSWLGYTEVLSRSMAKFTFSLGQILKLEFLDLSSNELDDHILHRVWQQKAANPCACNQESFIKQLWACGTCHPPQYSCIEG